jgi:hypothetical protein
MIVDQLVMLLLLSDFCPVLLLCFAKLSCSRLLRQVPTGSLVVSAVLGCCHYKLTGVANYALSHQWLLVSSISCSYFDVSEVASNNWPLQISYLLCEQMNTYFCLTGSPAPHSNRDILTCLIWPVSTVAHAIYSEKRITVEPQNG